MFIVFVLEIVDDWQIINVILIEIHWVDFLTFALIILFVCEIIKAGLVYPSCCCKFTVSIFNVNRKIILQDLLQSSSKKSRKYFSIEHADDKLSLAEPTTEI